METSVNHPGDELHRFCENGGFAIRRMLTLPLQLSRPVAKSDSEPGVK